MAHGGEKVLTRSQQSQMGMGTGVYIQKIEIIFPNVTSFQDWINADPIIIKEITERKLLEAFKDLANEGKMEEVSKL